MNDWRMGMQIVFLRFLAGLTLLLMVGTSAVAQTAANKSEHLLGPGDVIRITVYQNPDLTSEARLSENGSITFPLLGSIELDGLGLNAAEQKIARMLREGKFVIKPQVAVQLLEIRSAQISIIGQVGKPGRYPIDTTNSKVSEMIASAGGIAATGDDVVTLVGTRNGKPVKIDIDLPAIYETGESQLDVRVANGDIIYVHKAPNFYIYGEVQRPGVYQLERGTTLLKALAQSGGVTTRGTERGMKLHRRDETGAVTVLEPKMNDVLEAEDIIYIRESLF
ncbi:polysaccharide export protein EpsE [Methylibium sp.]|uniref:polysaccharide export protein EpsE n=1 Tax=Methylibium sp. TaxID=2067992 RepID=UPI0025D9B7F8|nr:polysaccharide export protein EpsE [Methylibium sp.]